MCALFVAPGCADSGDSDEVSASGSEGGDNPGGSGEQDSGGSESTGDSSIRGTFVFRDGTEQDLDVSANYRSYDFGEVVQYGCEGSDVDAGLSLGVTWRNETAIGTHMPSLSDGPGFVAAWRSADGEGIRATLPSGGELTFESVGTEPGDVVQGTAHALLHPEADDPDDRVSEIVEIEFRCVVSDAG